MRFIQPARRAVALELTPFALPSTVAQTTVANFFADHAIVRIRDDVDFPVRPPADELATTIGEEPQDG
jgi:hypothetical protein